MPAQTFRIDIDSSPLRDAVRILGDAASHGLAAALFREAETVMAKSKEEVPVDKGPLRSSGQVALPDITPSHVSVELGYGNQAVDYAVIVHEDLSAHHKPGQKAKYLEDPVLAAIPGMEERLGRTLEGEFRRGAP